MEINKLYKTLWILLQQNFLTVNKNRQKNLLESKQLIQQNLWYCRCNSKTLDSINNIITWETVQHYQFFLCRKAVAVKSISLSFVKKMLLKFTFYKGLNKYLQCFECGSRLGLFISYRDNTNTWNFNKICLIA